MSSTIELAYDRAKCIGIDACGACIEYCTSGAVTLGDDNRIILEQEMAANELHLAEICPVQALHLRLHEQSREQL